MIQNTVVFIVNGDGSFFKQPPNTKFTANSVNKNSIFVIAPFVNTASIIANFKVANKSKQDSRVATLTDMQPREITNESYVFDWNVWEVKVPQPTLQFLSSNRGSEILVSFNVGETQVSRVIPKFDTILGEITDKDFTLPIITVDGRYIVKVASYQYATGRYAFFNDTIIADNTEQEYKIFRAKYSGGLTPTVAFKVDPSIPMENFDDYEPTVVEQLILQANENSGDIVNLENEVVRIDDEVIRVEQSKYNFVNFDEGMGEFDIDKDCNYDTIYLDMQSGVNGTFPDGYRNGGFLIQTKTVGGDEDDVQTLFSPLQGKIFTREILDYDGDDPVWGEWKDHTYSKVEIDNKDANTLQQAKDYTYSQVEIDNKDTAIMNKANDLENANMFKDVVYNNVNGVLTFTRYDDTTKEIDLPLELLVESGYYDEATNELVLVLANGSEIRIPVDDLLTDLDAHNIRFNGSGTNYLVSETEVESAVKELDTQVAFKVSTSDIVDNLTSTDTDKPLSANQGKVLNDTTAKLAVSNVFTQPQQVPNATLAQHATNKLQVETMFEMFKRQLRGYNLAMPDLQGKEYLGDGNYRLYNVNNIIIDYNVYNGIYTINGTTTVITQEILFNIEPNTEYTLSYISGSGTLTGGLFTLLIQSPQVNLIQQDDENVNKQYTFITTTQTTLRFFVNVGRTFNNYQFKLQLEKGSQATPYTVPGQIPQYKIVGEE